MDRLISLVLKLINLTLRVFVTRIIPILIQGTIFSVNAMFYALAAVWVGWGPATERISDEWMVRAARMHWPSSTDLFMHYFMRTIAFGLILFGWILLAHVTVWLTRIILFGH
jgi:hypothetical protein